MPYVPCLLTTWNTFLIKLSKKLHTQKEFVGQTLVIHFILDTDLFSIVFQPLQEISPSKQQFFGLTMGTIKNTIFSVFSCSFICLVDFCGFINFFSDYKDTSSNAEKGKEVGVLGLSHQGPLLSFGVWTFLITMQNLSQRGWIWMHLPFRWGRPRGSTPSPTPRSPTRRRIPRDYAVCLGRRGSHRRHSAWGRRCGGVTWTPRWLCWGKPGKGVNPAKAARSRRELPPGWLPQAGRRLCAATAARWRHGQSQTCTRCGERKRQDDSLKLVVTASCKHRIGDALSGFLFFWL